MFEKFTRVAGSFILDTLETIVVATAIFTVVYLFLVQPHQVEGNSMEPNFHHGDHVLTDKFSYRFGSPARGDVIIFKYPKNPKNDYIKRIIALPGEEFEITDEGLKIYNEDDPDGILLNEVYLDGATVTRGGRAFPENVRIKVQEDKLVVMGDNRDNSSDSRAWGFVPIDNIIGKAWVRYWPLDAINKIESPNYKTDITFLPLLIVENTTRPGFLANRV